jgi:hypothetical protein
MVSQFGGIAVYGLIPDYETFVRFERGTSCAAR